MALGASTRWPRRAGTAALGVSLILLVMSCAGAETAGGPAPIRLAPVHLNPHRPDRTEVDRLHFQSGFALSAPDERFGGFSGLWLSDDAATMIAASDGGFLWELALEHDADGRLVGVRPVRVVVPAGLDGDPTFRLDQNVEALAEVSSPDQLVLAYEGTHRVRGFPMGDLEAVPTAWPRPQALEERSNHGIEGLASLGDGRLVALIEGGTKGENGWILDRTDGARAFAYAPAFGFEPTGAARHGEHLWILERRFSWVGGFQSRIARVPLADIREGARIEGEEIAHLRPPLTTENLEAIAVRQDAAGRTVLYLLSDDNFNVLQRTLLLQFTLIE